MSLNTQDTKFPIARETDIILAGVSHQSKYLEMLKTFLVVLALWNIKDILRHKRLSVNFKSSINPNVYLC